MSVDSCDCEPWDVWPNGKRQRAKKEHKCSACSETIRRGDLYYYEFAVFEGEPDIIKRCLRCDLIYDHLVERHKTIEDQHVDRKLRCGHDYQDVFEQEPPPEIARLAFMTPDELQSMVLAEGQLR